MLRKPRTFVVLLIGLLVLSLVPALQAQTTPVPSPQQLDQLLAPIALYPDSLLAQITTASTNPQEILDFDNWLAQNQDMTLSQLTEAAQQKRFDPAFIALAGFPQVVRMMAEHIDDYAAIGAAVSANQEEVSASVQRLRAQAYASGVLRSTPEQSVEVQQYGDQQPNYSIQPENPQVVYVPQYDPTVVYAGAGLYPGLLSFGLGIGISPLLVNDPWGWYGWGWNWGLQRIYYNYYPWGGWYGGYRPSHYWYRPRPIMYDHRPGYGGDWGYRPPGYLPPKPIKPPPGAPQPKNPGTGPAQPTHPGATPGIRHPSRPTDERPITGPTTGTGTGSRPPAGPSQPVRPGTGTPGNKPQPAPPTARPAQPAPGHAPQMQLPSRQPQPQVQDRPSTAPNRPQSQMQRPVQPSRPQSQYGLRAAPQVGLPAPSSQMQRPIQPSRPPMQYRAPTAPQYRSPAPAFRPAPQMQRPIQPSRPPMQYRAPAAPQFRSPAPAFRPAPQMQRPIQPAPPMQYRAPAAPQFRSPAPAFRPAPQMQAPRPQMQARPMGGPAHGGGSRPR